MNLARFHLPMLATALLSGCAGSEAAADIDTTGAEGATPMTPPDHAIARLDLPPIDREAPAEFETATFALG